MKFDGAAKMICGREVRLSLAAHFCPFASLGENDKRCTDYNAVDDSSGWPRIQTGHVVKKKKKRTNELVTQVRLPALVQCIID